MIEYQAIRTTVTIGANWGTSLAAAAEIVHLWLVASTLDGWTIIHTEGGWHDGDGSLCVEPGIRIEVIGNGNDADELVQIIQRGARAQGEREIMATFELINRPNFISTGIDKKEVSMT